MFTRLFCTLCLLMHFLPGSAQERYVEVIVQDTLLAEPKEWILLVTVDQDHSYVTADTVAVSDTIYSTTTTDVTSIEMVDRSTSLDTLKILARRFQGTVIENVLTTSRSGRSHPYSRMYESKWIQVRFTSRKSIQDFLKALSSYSDVHAEVIRTGGLSTLLLEQTLDARLMDMARQKASSLARLSGKKLGEVLFVTEATEAQSNSFQQFMEMMVQFGGMGEARTLMNQDKDKVKIEKSLKVRFALL